MITFVTAASFNHSKSLVQFLSSLSSVNYEYQIYVYDLGDLPDEYKTNLLEKFPKIKLKVFDYSKYPSYFNVQVNAGEYAWKPTLINEVLEELKINLDLENGNNYLIWCDAGNLIAGNIHSLLINTNKTRIFSPTSLGNIREFTYHTVCEYFNIHNNTRMLNLENRNAAVMSFYITSKEVQEFIHDYAKYAQIKEAICPEGSNRSNHRQDQALFTILYYFFAMEYKYDIINEYDSCIGFHKDCD
jgi:hypothetical protein